MKRENDGLGELAGQSRGFCTRQKLLEDRNAKFGGSVDDQHDEQRDAAKYVDGADAFGRVNRAGRVHQAWTLQRRLGAFIPIVSAIPPWPPSPASSAASRRRSGSRAAP